MTRVHVLEHFPNPGEYRDRRIRRDRWYELKTSYMPQGVLIDIAVPALDPEGNKLRDKFVDARGAPFPVEGYDLVFVHQTDMDAYVDEAADKAISVVCYGGGGESLDIGRIDSLVIDFLPLRYLESNIRPFFDKVVADAGVTLDALNTLIGFNPALESKLEVLHMCLTREGALRLLNGDFSRELDSERRKFWHTPLAALDPSSVTDRQPGHQPRTVNSVVKALSQIDDCFSEEYLKMLSLLERSLLADD